MLLLGIILSFFLQSKDIQLKAKIWSPRLLQLSVILLGASLNFNIVLKQGLQGIAISFMTISIVFILGFFGRKIFKVENTLGILITMGTAICGGSAIGALAPVINAPGMAVTIAIGVVFILNALAIFIFPWIGHLLNLSQDQFGMWAALAIHDTSSVVAASSIFGERALEIASTTKLIRALWIIPITLFFSFKYKEKEFRMANVPWFIVGFIIVSLVFTFLDVPIFFKTHISRFARMGFSITLFLIGLTFDVKKLKEVGIRPMLFGLVLWCVVSVLSLFLISYQ